MTTKVVEFIARSLVNEPDRVRVTETEDAKRHENVIQLVVAGDDMGRVIGRHGRIARALRTVATASAMRENTRVSVDIVSEEELSEESESGEE
ncbi:MAG: KH domain-containing protein [Eubacteriales bacterium]|nr:KH domain-containing protein [Eubacteriales bacterium]